MLSTQSRPDRIAITGCSMYAEAVVRATAFEHRLAAVIPDPGVMNAWPTRARLVPPRAIFVS